MPDGASASSVPWGAKAVTILGVDVRSLALFRGGLGIVLLADLVERSRWLRENYTDLGVLPRSLLAARPSAPFPSAHALGGSVAFEAFLFGLAGVFALMLLVGYRTRLAQIASWYLLVSLQVRNPLVQNAGDNILAVVLFLSLFLPLGAVASLDARARAADTRGAVLSPASAALLLQFAFVYVFAGLNKTGSEWHGEGSAIYQALSHSYWSRPLGEMLLSYPALLRVLTPAVPVFEIVGPLLLFSPVATGPLRCLMIPAFWIFQHSLGLAIELGVFPWVCTVAILPFVPTWLWDRAARLRGADPPPAGPPPPPPVPDSAGGGAACWLSRVGNGFVAALLVLVVAANLGVLDARLGHVLSVLRLTQFWTMYAPAPGSYDYWFTREGFLPDGTRLDLDRDGGGPSWERMREIHRNRRFKMYVEQMDKGDDALKRRYGRWLCREFNAGRPGEPKLSVVKVHFAFRPIVPGASPLPAETRVSLKHSCGQGRVQRQASSSRRAGPGSAQRTRTEGRSLPLRRMRSRNSSRGAGGGTSLLSSGALSQNSRQEGQNSAQAPS